MNKHKTLLLICGCLAVSLVSCLVYFVSLGRPAPYQMSSSKTDTVFIIQKGDTAQPHTVATTTPPPNNNKSIRTTANYPGPPVHMREYIPKLKPGMTLDLNVADTIMLQQIPGIGPGFAKRIYKYRKRLGGFYTPLQLQEVYGITPSKYDSIAPFVEIKTPPKRIYITRDSITKHPYLTYRQINALRKLLQQDSLPTWQQIMATGAFRKDDSLRLVAYFPYNVKRKQPRQVPDSLPKTANNNAQ